MKKFFCFFILFLFLCNAAFAVEETPPFFEPYMADLQKNIKTNWYPPAGNKSNRVVASFSIDRAGNISNIKIVQSAGLGYDNAAINAIRQASPVKPLPAECKEKSVDIQFTLDYNVFACSKGKGSYPKNIVVTDNANPEVVDYHDNFSGFGSNQSVKNVNNMKNIDITDERVYKAYSKRIEKIVLQTLPAEKYPHKKIVQIALTIKKDGGINDVSIMSSSGSKHYDQLVLASLKDCIFPNIPDVLNKDQITFHYQIGSAFVSLSETSPTYYSPPLWSILRLMRL